MADASDEAIPNLIAGLKALVHAKPYVWTVLSNFEPRLTWLGLDPMLERLVALPWSLLDAAYLPVLLSLDHFIEPRLNLSEDGRKRLHEYVYLWTGAVALYKLRGVWSFLECEEQLSQPSGPLNLLACIMFLTLLLVSYIMMAGFAMTFVCVVFAGRSGGPLRVVLALLVGLALGSLCFYPLAAEMIGR